MTARAESERIEGRGAEGSPKVELLKSVLHGLELIRGSEG